MTERENQTRLNEIRARLSAATPGPWRERRTAWEGPWLGNWEHPEIWGIGAGKEEWSDNAGLFHPNDSRYVVDEIDVVEIGYDRDDGYAEAAISREPDATFIANAPSDIEWLLGELEQR